MTNAQSEAIDQSDITVAVERRRTSLPARGCRPSNASPLFVLISNHEAIRGNHAVSASFLGLVHSDVGAAQNTINCIAVFPLRDTKAARHAKRCRFCKAQRFNGLAHVLGHFNRLGEVAAHKQTKLFATKSADNAA
jgi:hypothetical protein